VASASWLNVPNSISIFRLFLVPVFLWLRLSGEPEWALGVFILASVSDVLDGFLARVLNQRSKLGGVLDPVADKLLVFTAIFSLVLSGAIPLWLLVLLILRDLTLVAGALVVGKKHLELPSSPSRIGKYATFSLMVTVVLALTAASPRASPALEGYVVAFGFIAGLCVIISYLQYWSRFGYLVFAPERKLPSPGKGRTPP
jgi:cardiolipin synthase